MNTKERRTSKKMYSVTDLHAAMSNMVRKGKQVKESDSSDLEFSPRLKRIFIELECVYQRSRIKKWVTTLLDYK